MRIAYSFSQFQNNILCLKVFLVFLGFMFLGKWYLHESFEYNKVLLILNRRAGFPFINISHTLQVVTEPNNLTVLLLFTICWSLLLCPLTLSVCPIKSLQGTKCIMPCMYNHIISELALFLEPLHSLRSKLSNSGRINCNECQSWALRGILFLRLLRNMDYEWGRDQTCWGFNMYESFHMHRAQSFICHSRWGSGSISDTSEKHSCGLGFLAVCSAEKYVFHKPVFYPRNHVLVNKWCSIFKRESISFFVLSQKRSWFHHKLKNTMDRVQ